MGQKYFLGVFDRPVYKDWAFWHAVAWGLTLAVSTFLDPIEDSESPLWVDVPGTAATAFFLVGWTVAAIRRAIRIYDERRRGKLKAWRDGRTDVTVQDGTVGADPTPAMVSGPPSQLKPQPAGERGSDSPPRPTGSFAEKPTGETVGRREISNLLEAELFDDSRKLLPYPVARAARTVETSSDPQDQYQSLLDLGEALSISVGILAASWLRAFDPSNEAMKTLREGFVLRGVSQGHWHQVSKAAERAMATSSDALPGYVEGVRSRKGDRGLIEALGVVLAERNKSAHGGRPHNRVEAAVRIGELVPVLNHCLSRARFLQNSPWVLVEGVSFRREDRMWSVRLRQAMGDHPEFESVTRVIDQPLANDTFYVINGSMVLDLTPLLVMRYCDQCRQPEVCHADRLDERAGVSLKSFARGHQVFDQNLAGEIGSLSAGQGADDADPSQAEA